MQAKQSHTNRNDEGLVYYTDSTSEVYDLLTWNLSDKVVYTDSGVRTYAIAMVTTIKQMDRGMTVEAFDKTYRVEAEMQSNIGIFKYVLIEVTDDD